MTVRRVLRAFGKAQRPVAWSIFVLSFVVMVGVLSNIFSVPDKPSALLGALLLFWEGWSAVTDVENELDSDGSATE